MASITQLLSLTSETRSPSRPIPVASVAWDLGNSDIRASQGICIWNQGENHCFGPSACPTAVLGAPQQPLLGAGWKGRTWALPQTYWIRIYTLTRSPCSSYCPFEQYSNKVSQKKEKTGEKKAMYIFYLNVIKWKWLLCYYTLICLKTT